MAGTGFISILIVILTVIISYRGFKDHAFLEKYTFEVEKILLYKQYIRLVSSGFLHVNWLHLIFNMFSLLMFSSGLENYLGFAGFLLIYFSSLVGGNLLALLIHKNHGSYSSVGASGAVNGIVFASIALFPGMKIGLFLLPISMPAWIYGLLFVGFSIYGIRSRRENVGHEAHLGGALVGMLVALLMVPSAIVNNYVPILILLVPTLAFIFIILKRPDLLMVQNLFYKRTHEYSIDHRYNVQKAKKQFDIDQILEKIHKRGINSLTRKERQQLDEYSKKRD
jgi:membrane associated rhomboid family serine protease